MAIKKEYRYEISKPDGTYLDTLQDVASKFTYSQNINTNAVQAVITLQKQIDIVGPQLVGGSDPETLIRNDNLVTVIEISDYHPNGVTVFSGYISKWKAETGTADVIVTCLSLGKDLQDYVIPGGLANVQDVQQTSTNTSLGFWGALRFGQTFTTGPATYNVSQFLFNLYTSLVGGRTFTVKLWHNSGEATLGGTPMGSVSLSPAANIQQDFTFTFASPVDVSPNTSYFVTVELDGGSVFSDITTWGALAVQDSGDPYAGGAMYESNMGGAWDDSTKIGYDFYMKSYRRAETTERLYLNRDPSYILNDIMANYDGVVLPNGTYPDTGVTVPSYTFKVNTVLEGIQAVQKLGPADWYWYVDPATNILYYQQASTDADIVLVKGRHVGDLVVEATKEGLVNVVYFTGGDDGTGSGQNVFAYVADPASLAINRRGLSRPTDNRIRGLGSEDTARLAAQNEIDTHDQEQYTTIIVLPSKVIDLTLLHVGQIIGFSGYGNWIDDLRLQIVTCQPGADSGTLTVGVLPQRTSDAFQRVQATLLDVGTTDNPDVPS